MKKIWEAGPVGKNRRGRFRKWWNSVVNILCLGKRRIRMELEKCQDIVRVAQFCQQEIKLRI